MNSLCDFFSMLCILVSFFATLVQIYKCLLWLERKLSEKNAPGNRSDLGWDHSVEVSSRQVQCNYCKEIHSRGIYQLKHHLAGTRKNVSTCPSVPEKVREKFVALLYA